MLQLSDLKIAIIGLGYVGLPLAVEFGKQVPVIGFDIPVGQQNVFPFQNQIHQSGEFFSVLASGIQIVK